MSRKITLQILLWIFVFIFWYQIVYSYIGSTSNRLLFTLIDCITIIFPFYLVYILAVSEFFWKKSNIRFFLFILTITVLFGSGLAFLLKWLMQSNRLNINFTMSWNFDDMYNNRFAIVLLGCVTGLAARLSLDWLQTKKKIALIETEQMRSELQYLKNQINPHFLFNSLNTIYVQMNDSSGSGSDLLLKFAGILRYQLYECNTDFVPVIKEIEYIDNYIKFQEVRLNEQCNIEFGFDTSWTHERIAPLLLTPFIENAFKYVSADQKGNSYIFITINKKNNTLEFICNNSTNNNSEKKDKGIGISNTSRRLELIYPKKHLLLITSSDQSYQVTLKINV